jgi:hypothetical protein
MRQPPPRTQAVRQVSLPADARALSTLARIDYEDAFDVTAGVAGTPRGWVHAVLEDAPTSVRRRLLLGWTALGLKLEPWSGERVLGWNVKHDDSSFVLLAAESWLGIRGELLFRTEPDGLLFATFVQHTNPAARALWAAITRRHQDVVRSLLTHAASRVGKSTNAAQEVGTMSTPHVA